MGPGSRPPDAHEQPRPGGRRAAPGPGRLRRHREGGARTGRATTGSWRRCATCATTRPCSCRAASRSASSAPTPTRRACSSPTRTWCRAGPPGSTSGSSRRAGLMMYGQMTAGSWIYIGTQGILQGTYETFAQAGRTHFGTDDLAGRLVLSGGLGGMGGAQPLAATMLGAAYLGVDVDPERIAQAARPGLPRRGGRARSTTRSRPARRRPARAAGRSRWGSAGTRPRSTRSWCGAASPPTSSPTRPRPTTRSTATCRPGSPSPRSRRSA